MQKKMMAAAVLALAISKPAHAQSLFDTFRDLKGTVETLTGNRGNDRSADTQEQYEVAKFTVADIGLGMSPEEVERIMRSKGFNVSKVNAVYSFPDLVRIEAERLRQPNPLPRAEKPVASIFGTDAQGNHLSVDFVSFRDDTQVSSVTLTFNENTVDVASLRGDVLAKYGTPTRDDRHDFNTMRWCSPEEQQCRRVGSTAPQLSFSQFVNSHRLSLTNANAMNAERQRQVTSYFNAPAGDRQRALLGGS